MCGSVRVGEKKPKSVWWNNKVKAAVRRKEAAWKKELEANSEERKKDVWKLTNEKRKVKRFIYQKQVSNVKGGKVESCSRIKDGNGKLVQGKDEVQRI